MLIICLSNIIEEFPLTLNEGPRSLCSLLSGLVYLDYRSINDNKVESLGELVIDESKLYWDRQFISYNLKSILQKMEMICQCLVQYLSIQIQENFGTQY